MSRNPKISDYAYTLFDYTMNTEDLYKSVKDLSRFVKTIAKEQGERLHAVIDDSRIIEEVDGIIRRARRDYIKCFPHEADYIRVGLYSMPPRDFARVVLLERKNLSD